MYLPNLFVTIRMWLKESKTGLNSEFSFSLIGFVTKTKEHIMLDYLSIVGGIRSGFMPFSRALVLCKMHTASSRIWTWVADSIFIHYAKRISKEKRYGVTLFFLFLYLWHFSLEYESHLPVTVGYIYKKIFAENSVKWQTELRVYITFTMSLEKKTLSSDIINNHIFCIANVPGDWGSIPGWVIPKTQKMVLNTSLLNTQHYKIYIKDKVEQSRKSSCALSNTSV